MPLDLFALDVWRVFYIVCFILAVGLLFPPRWLTRHASANPIGPTTGEHQSRERLRRDLERLLSEATDLLRDVPNEYMPRRKDESDFIRRERVDKEAQARRDISIWRDTVNHTLRANGRTSDAELFLNCPDESMVGALACHIDRLTKIIARLTGLAPVW